MAADLKALIAEHKAASPLQLPNVSMAVEVEGAQRSIPAAKLVSNSEPEAEPQQARTNTKLDAEAVCAEPATGATQVHSQALQDPAPLLMHDPMSRAAPSAAAAEGKPGKGMSEATSSTDASQGTCKEASQAPLKQQQAEAVSRTMQIRSAEASQGRGAATAEGTSSQGSFLSEALSGVSAQVKAPKEEQLSTSQAQQIADAAAAGKLPAQPSGNPSTNGTGPHNSVAAVFAKSSKGLTARTLQPPKTSKHAL